MNTQRKENKKLRRKQKQEKNMFYPMLAMEKG